MSHDGPEFLIDEDGVVAQCSCGWETETYETKREAEEAFNQEHFFASIDRSPGFQTGPYRNVLLCSFCGQEGHSKNNCSRRPLFKI